jgi:uncharacterized membrane protein YidH (DUF202 family)
MELNEYLLPKNSKAEFNLKEITQIIALFSLFLAVLIFVFIKLELLPVEHYFSFKNSAKLVLSTIITSIGLIIIGVVLTLLFKYNLIRLRNS